MTATGEVGGSGKHIISWKGIPYALAPTGHLRWRAPQLPVQWREVRWANKFGPICPQPDFAITLKLDESEDCLTLNIWSPKGAKKLPVMVWIHGGGFRAGSGSQLDGRAIAKHRVVLVTINYRLGVFGFLAHPDLSHESEHHASGNYGLLDQITALHWVQDNIVAFGGDPKRVTLFGESAGGTSIGYLLASPLAKGLFRRAILESPSRLFLPDPCLKTTADGMTSMEAVGQAVATRIADFRGLSTADVMMRSDLAMDTFFGEGGSGSIGLRPESNVHMPKVRDRPWWAFVDGYVIPQGLLQAFDSAEISNVPVIVGTNADEGRGFVRDLHITTVEEYKSYLRRFYPPIADDLFRLYPASNAEEIKSAVARIINDYMFLYGSREVAKYVTAGRAHAYFYRFTRVMPGESLGALHGAEVPYVFGDVDTASGKYSDVDVKLSEEMMRRWVEFARRGDPNPPGRESWPKWQAYKESYLNFGNRTQEERFELQEQMKLFARLVTFLDNPKACFFEAEPRQP
jgi:para-nitrobenzyl esterase